MSKAKLAKDAIVTYLDEQERQLERIREGLADAAAGRVVPHDEVARWLDSWGTEDELPPPTDADLDAPVANTGNLGSPLLNDPVRNRLGG